jgi:hypothetical protein
MTHENPKSGADGAGLVAFQIEYEGPGTYPLPFEDSGFGVVLDDDGDTGYLYITSADFEDVHDTLYVYSSTGAEAPTNDEDIFVLYNMELMKAGLFYRDMFWAVVDFKNSKACTRTGMPECKPGGWCTGSHSWDEKMMSGLTFKRVDGPGANA